MDFKYPGSQAKEGSFFGLESALEGLEPGYHLAPTYLRLNYNFSIKIAYYVYIMESRFIACDRPFLKFDIWLNRYPGGPLLNPLGLAKDIKNAHEWKLKEIKNG